MRVVVVAPGRNLTPDVAERVTAVAADNGTKITFHPQCFLSHGHFAGTDADRAAAFIEAANSLDFDAVWFARGGYGACRILDALPQLSEAAHSKTYLGYSDSGFLLAALYKLGIGRQVHAPMPIDITRVDGEAAIRRVCVWLRDPAQGLESGLSATLAIAMNAVILAALQGTPWMPDLAGHQLLLEEIGEYDYRFDRLLFQIFAGFGVNKPAAVRLGRVSEVPVNTIDFGLDAEGIVMDWCNRYGIPYVGRADIGHDADNKIVPFGRL